MQASKILRLSPQTLSGQIHAFEEVVGHKLFVRRGRRLTLTEVGRIAYGYADDIFSLGEELSGVLERGVLERPQRLEVGLVEALPKIIVRRMLEPFSKAEPPVVVACREGTIDNLAARLASHELDVVLADEPLPPGAAVRAFNHLLGETGVTFFCAEELGLQRQRFPSSLDGAPFLLPFPGAPLRRHLDGWFVRHGITPRIVAEIEDSALLKVYGRAGEGVFCAPTVVAREISEMYDVRPIGSTDEVTERFYAISIERRVKNPAVARIVETARAGVFAAIR